MNNLIKHAENEMKLAGLYDKDSDYGGMIPKAVMALVKAHSEQGHSGGSHHLVLSIFNQVVNFKSLTPPTNNPSEWMEVESGKTWQNIRQSTCFSEDGGKTYYDIDEAVRPFQKKMLKRRETTSPQDPATPLPDKDKIMNKTEIKSRLRAISYVVETLPASELQTKVSVMVSDLNREIEDDTATTPDCPTSQDKEKARVLMNKIFAKAHIDLSDTKSLLAEKDKEIKHLLDMNLRQKEIIQENYETEIERINKSEELKRQLAEKEKELDSEIKDYQAVIWAWQDKGRDLHKDLDDTKRLLAEKDRDVKDWERWIKEVLSDFKINFDDHKVSWRMSLVCELADKNRLLANERQRFKSKVKFLGKVIMDKNRIIGDLKKEIKEPGWLCADCGNLNGGFTTYQHFEGDYDVMCDKCGSDNTGEFDCLINAMINENDELQAECQTQSIQLADKDKRIVELEKELNIWKNYRFD